MPQNKKDLRWLTKAVQTAEKGIHKRWGGPFGAVITRKNKLLAAACNTVLKTNDSTCHAEINAIRIACKKLNTYALMNCTVYSTTEPCPMCFSALHWAKVKKIIYSSTIQDVQKLGFNELNLSNAFLKRKGKSPVVVKKLIHSPCQKLLKKWASLPQKKTY